MGRGLLQWTTQNSFILGSVYLDLSPEAPREIDCITAHNSFYLANSSHSQPLMGNTKKRAKQGHLHWLGRRENTLCQSFRKYVPFCSLFSCFQSPPSFPLFLLSYTLFHCRGGTPVNLAVSELSLSGQLMLQIPKTSSKTQTKN